MKLTLDCPYASYGPDMKIKCAKADGLCGNQRYRPCKGWNVLTEWAKNWSLEPIFALTLQSWMFTKLATPAIPPRFTVRDARTGASP